LKQNMCDFQDKKTPQ